VDTHIGGIERVDSLRSDGEKVTLTSPLFAEDIALRIMAK
jgi:hypothetical protein